MTRASAVKLMLMMLVRADRALTDVEADAHDAGLPRPGQYKVAKLMLMMLMMRASAVKGGEADAHDARLCGPGQ